MLRRKFLFLRLNSVWEWLVRASFAVQSPSVPNSYLEVGPVGGCWGVDQLIVLGLWLNERLTS